MQEPPGSLPTASLPPTCSLWPRYLLPTECASWKHSSDVTLSETSRVSCIDLENRAQTPFHRTPGWSHRAPAYISGITAQPNQSPLLYFPFCTPICCFSAYNSFPSPPPSPPPNSTDPSNLSFVHKEVPSIPQLEITSLSQGAPITFCQLPFYNHTLTCLLITGEYDLSPLTHLKPPAERDYILLLCILPTNTQ